MTLNLPQYAFNIKNTSHGTVILDKLRNKFVALTPEEWVRQNFTSYLINEKQFPAALMANEVSLVQNGIKRRCDTLVANRDGSPFVIVEYKAPSIAITQNTFNQIVRYNLVFHAKYLMVSNGLAHYCCRISYDPLGYEFLADIPCYDML